MSAKSCVIKTAKCDYFAARVHYCPIYFVHAIYWGSAGGYFWKYDGRMLKTFLNVFHFQISKRCFIFKFVSSCFFVQSFIFRFVSFCLQMFHFQNVLKPHNKIFARMISLSVSFHFPNVPFTKSVHFSVSNFRTSIISRNASLSKDWY